MLSHFKKLDWILISSACLLAGIGLLSIYSSSSGEGDFANFKKQLIFLALGIGLMLFFSFFDWRILRENGNLILILYFFSLASLVGLFFLAPEIRGVQRWYKIGPFSVDPVEFIKIILIIILAKYFSSRHIEMYRIRHVLISSLYVIAPATLTFFQPDFGSIAILISLWIGVLMVSGIKLRHLVILFFCFLLIFSFSWFSFMKDYQKDRIISFIVPADPLGSGWSQNQSKIAIGSGGLWGQGIMNGSQTQHGFLPEPQTDFIFSAIAEEMGLIGIAATLFLFSLFIWRIFKAAIASRSNFPRLFSIGFVTVLVSQIFINIGMNLGLLPVIGISLPLISYGGSSLIMIFLAIGVVQNIKSNP